LSRFNKLCIVGLGYIGLPTASTFASCGMNVLGVDINAGIIDTLMSGRIHIHEPGLLEVVQKGIETGKLKVANKPAPADAFIIAVPTPFYDGKKADLRAVKAAAHSIVPVLQKGNLVILESTSPPRTTMDIVAPILEESGLEAGKDFYLAYSPERVLPGKILRELIENDRVIGGITSESAEAGRDLYSCFVKGQIVLTDSTTAEMVKLMENTYRDINIAIANEFSRLANRFGVDVWEAIPIANRHPRVDILHPGIGVGGHCISVDPWFFVEAAPDLTNMIRTAREVNDSQPFTVLDLARNALGSLDGKRIAVLGLAYKANVDDLRESPAVEIVETLVQYRASVIACEPYKPDALYDDFEVCGKIEDSVLDADAVLFLVPHQEFVNLDIQTIVENAPTAVIIDAVNCLAIEKWEDAGFTVYRLGDGKRKAVPRLV
jgi:UDP-N-acetyl-D-mannosaminuronic acid dehydrogenase